MTNGLCRFLVPLINSVLSFVPNLGAASSLAGSRSRTSCTESGDGDGSKTSLAKAALKKIGFLIEVDPFVKNIVCFSNRTYKIFSKHSVFIADFAE
jgi:hypothetical protein